MTGAKDQYGNVYGIKTKEELIGFSKIFFDQRVIGFKKDMAICVEDDSRSQHAILPGLMTCISFLDLLSGLYAGRLDAAKKKVPPSPGILKSFVDFTADFFDPAKYDSDRIKLFYVIFRHKLAHLGHPYAVFNTGEETDIGSTFGLAATNREEAETEAMGLPAPEGANFLKLVRDGQYEPPKLGFAL